MSHDLSKDPGVSNIKVGLSTLYENLDFRCEFPCAAMIYDDFVCFFRLADDHFASKSKMVCCISSDYGKSWTKPLVLAEKSMAEESSSWNCPAISLIDGNKFILCSEENIKKGDSIKNEKAFNVKLHFWKGELEHSELRWDKKWQIQDLDGVFGFNPDRILVLPNGKWLMGWHFYGDRIVYNGRSFSENPNLIQCVSFSDDGGKTWLNHTVVSDVKNANLCDGNIIFIDDKRLACFMRDHSFNGAPSYVSFSDDFGVSWSKPNPLPFCGHHNITKKIGKNVFFTFYRNVVMRDGNVLPDDVGVWGTFFNINDFTKVKSIEIERDGTLWQNCGWGDTILVNKNQINCYYYLTGDRKNPVIRQAEVCFLEDFIKSLE